MDVSVQSFLHSCRTPATIEEVVYESLDLSSLHNRIKGFSFDIILIDALKPSSLKCIADDLPKIKDEISSGGSAVRDSSKNKRVLAKNANQKAI
jgi:hypothetical protein